MNELFFLLQTSSIAGIALLLARLGKESLIAFLTLTALLANLFLLKEVRLFGLSVCCSDAFAVGYLFTLNLIQEFFGQNSAKKGLLISSILSLVFLYFSWIHTSFIPIPENTQSSHFVAILGPLPRLVASSLASFILVQLVDISFFALLREKLSGKFFPLRAFISLFLAEILDTILYSLFALLGQVSAFNELLVFSMIIKSIAACLVIPFASFAKKWVRNESTI